MTDLVTLARTLHVVAVVLWVGGVGFVTAVVLPYAMALGEPERRVEAFEAIERRFAPIARVMVLIVGATGFYMVWAFDAWWRFREARFWWMHVMVLVWAVFVMILFVVEPVLHKRIAGIMRRNPGRTLFRVARVHWLLLAAGLIAVAGAIFGVHG